jgi:hypothetical protein
MRQTAARFPESGDGPVLGRGQTLTECFRFINSKAGEQAMERCHLTTTHRQML